MYTQNSAPRISMELRFVELLILCTNQFNGTKQKAEKHTTSLLGGGRSGKGRREEWGTLS